MSRIYTNVNALNSLTSGVLVNRELSSSLEKLSSGLRINKAADDASGMAIADSLRSQASALGQAIRNANDAIGMIQTADKAMDEQIKILDTVKTKATQAAQDGQTTETRYALQSDIKRLLEELDNIANTTSFNGQQMLSGSFTNKEFQIGAYSNTTVKASIQATQSTKIGHTRFEAGAKEVSALANTGNAALDQLRNILSVSAGTARFDNNVTLVFRHVDGLNSYTTEPAVISTSAGTGIGALAAIINKNSDLLGVRATFNVMGSSQFVIQSGTINGLSINGITIGDINEVQRADKDGRLINAINAQKERTGVEASLTIDGRLQLTSTDGRAISIHTLSGSTTYTTTVTGGAVSAILGRAGATVGVLGGGSFNAVSGNTHAIIGRLNLVRLNARDIIISGVGYEKVGLHSAQGIAQYTANLRAVTDEFDANIASAIGANANYSEALKNRNGIGVGVTSLKGAMAVMDMAEAAQRYLDRIRADLGSAQQQLVVTINNISVTQVNVKSAESTIRDTDFAEESSTFTKNNILAQSGNFALAQANQIQQNVLKLLQ